MPSGITHILLVKNLQQEINQLKLKAVLAKGKYFLQVGAVGPDLPYSSSFLDDDLFFSSESNLADLFHYNTANRLPIIALRHIKENTEMSEDERQYAFCFFIGYISHIVADGVMHPFVRDKVGNYQENQTAHRELEMRIDVLFNNHLTKQSSKPTEFNYTNIHDELENIKDYPEGDTVCQLFSDSIYTVYGERYDKDKIKSWVNGLYRLLSVAEGHHPAIYRGLSILDGIVYKNYSDLEDDKENILTLGSSPIDDLDSNFINSSSVHFINDCIPQFYERFIPIAIKAFDFVFNNGPEVTEEDIPQINLDTGRLEQYAYNLNYIPAFWS